VKEYLLQRADGPAERVRLKHIGNDVEVTLKGKTYIFSREELKKHALQAALVNGQVLVSGPRLQRAFEFKPYVARGKGATAAGAGLDHGQLKALFPGKVVKVLAKENAWNKKGKLLLVMESMKMEYNYKAPKKLFIQKVLVQEGQVLSKGDEFFHFHE